MKALLWLCIGLLCVAGASAELLAFDDFEDGEFNDTFVTANLNSSACDSEFDGNGYNSLAITADDNRFDGLALRFDACKQTSDPLTGNPGCHYPKLLFGSYDSYMNILGTPYNLLGNVTETNELYVKYWARFAEDFDPVDEYMRNFFLELDYYPSPGNVRFRPVIGSMFGDALQAYYITGLFTPDEVSPVSNQFFVRDGQWHKYEFYVDYTTNSIQSWVDDQLVFTWIEPRSVPRRALLFYFYPAYEDCTSSIVQLDDFEIWDTYPSISTCGNGLISSLCECGGSSRTYGYCLDGTAWDANSLPTCAPTTSVENCATPADDDCDGLTNADDLDCPALGAGCQYADIRITAGDNYILYFNGQYVGHDGDVSDIETYTVPLRDGENVVAVNAFDDGSVPAYVAAEVEYCGNTLTTDTSWTVTEDKPYGWKDIGFNDAGWASASLNGATLPSGFSYNPDPIQTIYAPDQLDYEIGWFRQEFTVDEEQVFYRDADGDGYGDQSDTVTGLTPPNGYIDASPPFDCDDANEFAYPTNSNAYCDCSASDGFDLGATDDFCDDAVDQDCDGVDLACGADETVLDDGDATSDNGAWSYGDSFLAYYGTNYLYSTSNAGDWIEWQTPLTSGEYELYASWSAETGRPTSATYTITDNSGSTDIVVNQEQGDGQWNRLGTTYNFVNSATVRLTSGASGEGTSADALRFVFLGVVECTDADGDGWVVETSGCDITGYSGYGDCDDTPGSGVDINPGALDLCDTIDNDCDAGSADGSDEDWFGNPSYCGVGECASTGSYTCTAGDQDPACTPGTPSVEVCDGLDNNCDGLEDAFSESCGSGDCLGTRMCTLGSWSDCDSVGNDAGVCASCNNLGQEILNTSQDADCDSYDIAGILSCTNTPDGVDGTLDVFTGFDSECLAIDTCSQAGDWQSDMTHTCDTDFCPAADCEIDVNCASFCSDQVYFFSGSCDSECACAYEQEDCDSSDGWYPTGDRDWIEFDNCTEVEIFEEESLDFSCDAAQGCISTITDTRWSETTNFRNKADGVVCNDGFFCTENDVCSDGVCGGSALDCSDGILCTTDSCIENPDPCTHDESSCASCGQGFIPLTGCLCGGSLYSGGYCCDGAYSDLSCVTPNDIIIDNTDLANVSSFGTWTISSDGLGFHGNNYSVSTIADDWFAWSAHLPTGGYRVYISYVEAENRPQSVSYEIVHASGSDIVSLDQTQNGGQWNFVGQFSFDGVSIINMTNPENSVDGVVADAIRFEPIDCSPADFNCDGAINNNDYNIFDQAYEISTEPDFSGDAQVTMIDLVMFGRQW